MKTTLLAILACASLASAGEEYDYAELEAARRAEAQRLEQIERQLQQLRQEQREAERERHFQAERDFTFRSMFGK